MDEQKKKHCIIKSTEYPSEMIHPSQHVGVLQYIGNCPDFAAPRPPTSRPPTPRPSADVSNDNSSSCIDNPFDSNNQVSFENSIRWKGEDYALPPLQKVSSIEQALFHLKNKSHYEDHLKQATNEEEKTMIRNVYNVLEDFVVENFTAVQSSVHVSNIILKDKGVYIAYLHKVPLPKFGFTQNYGRRFKDQDNVDFVAKIDMKLDKNCVNKTIDRILVQNCPMLQYHPDRYEELRETISFHIHELIVACSFETYTKTIGELFLSLPSATVRDILTLPEEIKTNLHQIASKLPSCHCLDELYTWPTLSSHLESLAKMEPNGFLASKISQSKPFGFATHYLNVSCLLPSIQHSYQDVVVSCPRAEQVSILAEQVKDAFHSNQKDIVDIMKSWTSTYGTSSYVHPSPEMLAKCAMEKIRSYLSSSMKPDSFLKMDRCIFESIQKHYPTFFEKIFDLDRSTDILPDNKFSICYLQCPKQPVPVIITSSFFMMVTENTSLKHRVEAARSYFMYLQFLKLIGVSSPQIIRERISQLNSFLMTLVDFDQGYRHARKKIFPHGYFCSQISTAVPRSISLGVNETLLLHHELGEDIFNNVLKAFGVQVPCPLSDDYRCSGIAGYFECESHDDNEYGFISCIAVTKPWHPFHGIFVCHNCHRKVERAELCYYKDNYDAISDKQKMRMQELIKRKEYHNRYVNSIYVNARSKTRKRRNDEFQKSTKERRALLDIKAQQANIRGDVKQSKIENRLMESKTKHYKEGTRQKMIQSLIVFGRRYPSRYIYNNHLINVCDAVLKREIELGNENMIRSEKLGLMKYYKYEYMYAIQRAGYQRFEQTKQYVLVDDQRSDNDIEQNMKVKIEELIEESVAEVYNDL